MSFEYLKNNKFILECGIRLKMLWADIYKMPIGYTKYLLRKYGILKEPEYEEIKKLRNTHKGERCFLIATGPSLTFEDLALLKNETTFAVNSIVKILDKIDYTPSYIGIQDALVFEKIGNQIENCKIPNVFLTPNLFRKINDKIKGRYIQYPLYSTHNTHQERRKMSSGFTNDASQIVYDGYSITYSLLQIAVYMGFDEIYLLGCDCSYDTKGGKHHFVESGHFDKQAATVGERMIYAYSVAKKWLDKNRPDVKVYNATRGGMLEVFPRKTLDEVFKV